MLRPELPQNRADAAPRGPGVESPRLQSRDRAPFIWIGSPDTPDGLGWISARWPLIDPGTERMTP